MFYRNQSKQDITPTHIFRTPYLSVSLVDWGDCLIPSHRTSSVVRVCWTDRIPTCMPYIPGLPRERYGVDLIVTRPF